ncbi:MAG: hypothetical protein LC776_11435 [Acidobacteria bacterium]|nr:hypothetical protein [Acidobacteriota bacterium]
MKNSFWGVRTLMHVAGVQRWRLCVRLNPFGVRRQAQRDTALDYLDQEANPKRRRPPPQRGCPAGDAGPLLFAGALHI